VFGCSVLGFCFYGLFLGDSFLVIWCGVFGGVFVAPAMILAAVRCFGDGFGGFSWLRQGCWWGWTWQSWLLVLWCGSGGVVEVMRWRWFGDEIVTW
jgi:hypothetical protein